jgi:DNA-binding NarL/FixJ family response regulator
MQEDAPLAQPPVTTIFIVEDHPIVRDGLQALLAGQSDLKVVGTANDVMPAIEQLEAAPVDVALVDLSLKSSDGLNLIKIIRHRWPATRVLVLSGHADSLFAERSLKAGAQGYINKAEMSSKIVEAIRHVLAGKIYLSPEMTEKIVQATLRGK